MLSFVATPSDSDTLGYFLVVAFVLVYSGIGLSTAWYWYEIDRFRTTLRGCLIVMLYNKSLELDIKESSNNASLTLMSTDVEKAVLGVQMMLEFASNLVIIIGAWGLLYRQIQVSYVCLLIYYVFYY